MATQKPPSANRAQWVTAVSMAIIACCLVLILIREYSSLHKEEPVAAAEPVKPAQPEPVAAKHVPSFARPKPVKSADVKTESSSPAPTVAKAEVAEPTFPPPAAAIPVAGEKFVSTGLAPLTFLATNNSGIITGRVILKGTPPPESKIQMDAICGALHPKPLMTRRFLVSKSGGLANVFVYIQEHPAFDVPAAPSILNQVDCQFEPYVMGLMVGQDLVITNSDRFPHNIDVTSFGNSAALFNITQMSGRSTVRRFSNSEIPLRVKCDLHPWMFAYLFVVDHPYFAVTDQDGYFTITNVPSGKYSLAVSHVHTSLNFPTVKIQPQSVTIKSRETTTVNFVIDISDKSLAKR